MGATVPGGGGSNRKWEFPSGCIDHVQIVFKYAVRVGGEILGEVGVGVVGLVQDLGVGVNSARYSAVLGGNSA